MNHRQWKKNFKKNHGRNPYEWEDKKKRRKSLLGKLDAAKISTAFLEMGQVLSRTCEIIVDYMTRTSRALANGVEAFKETFNNY